MIYSSYARNIEKRKQLSQIAFQEKADKVISEHFIFWTVIHENFSICHVYYRNVYVLLLWEV